MVYSVWLFTRPLSYAMFLPPLASTSDGKDHLRHWGVLVNQMTLMDLQVMLSRQNSYGANDNTELGVMYELHRDESNMNTVSINREFGMNYVRNDWRMFSMQYVGTTARTHDFIKQEGTYQFYVTHFSNQDY
jgi:hypothetical protein